MYGWLIHKHRIYFSLHKSQYIVRLMFCLAQWHSNGIKHEWWKRSFENVLQLFWVFNEIIVTEEQRILEEKEIIYYTTVISLINQVILHFFHLNTIIFLFYNIYLNYIRFYYTILYFVIFVIFYLLAIIFIVTVKDLLLLQY
jgi:hypothetical protein